MEKFSSQIERKTLKRLRKFAADDPRSLSRILTEAVEQYLNRAELRPAFESAAQEVLDDNAELLKRLAR